MKLETFNTPTLETFVEAKGFNVTATHWSNGEGVNIMAHGKDLSLRLAGAFRWEEIDALLVALTAARSA